MDYFRLLRRHRLSPHKSVGTFEHLELDFLTSNFSILSTADVIHGKYEGLNNYCFNLGSLLTRFYKYFYVESNIYTISRVEKEKDNNIYLGILKHSIK